MYNLVALTYKSVLFGRSFTNWNADFDKKSQRSSFLPENAYKSRIFSIFFNADLHGEIKFYLFLSIPLLKSNDIPLDLWAIVGLLHYRWILAKAIDYLPEI